jgi:hypothetical protein
MSRPSHLITCQYKVGYLTIFPHSDWLRGGRPRGRNSSPGRGSIFLLPTSSRPSLGPTQPSIQWVLGVKQPGRQLTTHPQIFSEVKNARIYTATSPYVFLNIGLPFISHTVPVFRERKSRYVEDRGVILRGCPGFTSWPGSRLSSLIFFVVLLSCSQ